MKKYALIGTAALAIIVAGCGNDSTTGSSVTPATPEPEPASWEVDDAFYELIESEFIRLQEEQNKAENVYVSEKECVKTSEIAALCNIVAGDDYNTYRFKLEVTCEVDGSECMYYAEVVNNA